jgi:hypothetical protein
MSRSLPKRVLVALDPKEHDHQTKVFRWAEQMVQLNQFPELAFMFAVPNGAKLPYVQSRRGQWSPQAMKLRREGMRSGVPDIVLPVARGGYHHLYIEMKRKTATDSKVGPNQHIWIAALMNQGSYAVVCKGADQAIEVITSYLTGKITKELDDERHR